MTGRKKKPNDLEKNIPDETVSVLLVQNDLPKVKELLKDKPHLTLIKHVEIDAALRELNTFVVTLAGRLLVSEREEEVQKKDEELTIAVASLVKTILDYAKYSESVFILKILSTLSNLTTCDNISAKVKTSIAELCERFMELSHDHCPASIKIGMFTLNYLLDLTLLVENDKALKKNIKRVWSLRKFLDHLDLFSPSCCGLLSKLMSTVTNKSYLRCKEGEHVIGHIMSRDISLVKNVHKIVITTIPNTTKHLASSYGSAYFVAWNSSSDEIQKEVEDCIQDIMIKVLNIPRAGYDMPKAGANGFAILQKLHQARNRKSFSHVLNHLYSAVLWRNLGSDDPWKRCNAAQVFLDVFPLEKPYSTAPENSEYMERQIKTMKDLLLDDSHFVRVISVKGVCASLSTSIELFSVGQLRDICNILFDDLPFDSSSYMVRKAVFEGLEMMLSLPPSNEQTLNPCQAVIEPILYCLHHSFYDENEKVRKAFIKMLIKIKEQDSVLNVRYWRLISLPDILNQLAIEKPHIGELLAKLLKDDVYPKKSDINKTISRLCKMIDWNTEGIKNFFRFSQRVLTVNEAYSLIVTLIGVIRKKLKDYLDSQENENSAAQAKKSAHGKSKSSGKGTLEDISNKNLGKEKDSDCETSITSSSSGSPTPPADKQQYELLGKHKYISGLIQMATITWVVHRKELGENEQYLTNLYSLATNSVPMLLKHYKDTPVYYSTVNFASLIPLGKLRPYSTISSACISELKKATDSIEISKLECLIYSLCSWNLGVDVLELAGEWLNFAFREQDLNNTAMTKAGQKKAKVHFQQKDGKPLLALKLLDILFSDLLNETRILQKNYEQLHDFYTCLERINIILERKMINPESFNKPNTSLTDEFIYRAYCRYLRLMHSLHRPDTENVPDSLSSFDASVALTNAIIFAANVLFPHIPQEEDAEPNLAVKCCLAVVKEATLTVRLGVTSEAHSRALCVFAIDLLSLNKGVWFLEEIIYMINDMADHVQYYMPNDDWHLLSKMLPSLMEKALLIISDLDNSVKSYKEAFKDIPKFRKSLFGLLKALHKCYGENSELFLNSFRWFIQTCILFVQQDIYDEEEVHFRVKLDDHPYFVSFVLKNIMIKPNLNVHIVPAVTHFINEFSQDADKILSCLSLIYTLTHCAGKRLNKLALEIAVQTCYEVITAYTPVVQSKDSDDFSSSSINFDVKKISEPILLELSKFLNCSLIKIDKQVH